MYEPVNGRKSSQLIANEKCSNTAGQQNEQIIKRSNSVHFSGQVLVNCESTVSRSQILGISQKDDLLNDVTPSSSSDATVAATCARLNVRVDDSFCVRSIGGLQGQPRWQCNMCPKFYATRNHLTNHMLSLHYGVKPFACTVCHKSFNQATRLKFHMLSHNKDKFVSIAGNSRSERYSCSVCLRSFTQAMHLRRHLLTHDNKQPYSCRSCDKGFAIMSELQSHLQLHKQQHQQEQNGDCAQVAEVTFAQKTDDELEAAVTAAAVADGVEMRCNICGRKFLFPSQLKDHMLTHSQVRRYECSVCKMRFLKEHHLKAHCLTHTNIRAHKCDMCGRSFTLKGNLIRHLITHSKERAFECDICGKRFSQRQTLKTHLVIHADTKPYSCDVCGKALARAHNLKSHMSLHRQEKPFKCPLCNSAFTMKGNLHRHFKEKHKEVALQQHQQQQHHKLANSGDVIGHVVSSQCLVPNGRSHKDLHQLENVFSFGMYSQPGAVGSGTIVDTVVSGKKRKRSPKKRVAPALHAETIQQQQQQNPTTISNLTVLSPCGGHAMHTSGGSILNYYCNDGACAFKFQGQAAGYVGNGIACGSANGGGGGSSPQQQLMQKLHSLHSAIDTLALNSGQSGIEKVSAIHVAIDEMVNATVQKQQPQPNHNLNSSPHNNFSWIRYA